LALVILVFGPCSHHRPFRTKEKFGGVIATRADNTQINQLDDISGKIVAAAAISSFGGGQMQFRELQNAGLSYINDPKQIVFTGNQAAIVKGVINGDFDVGFVRTDQIERTVDDDGNPVDGSLLKVLEPKDNQIDGQPFPFTASTRLYPEWNLGALDFVPSDVSAEVQAAMLALHEHSLVGKAIEKCLASSNTASNTTSNTTGLNSCDDLTGLAPEARCDATKEVAEVANRAMTNGGYAGFRTTQSYSDIRAMLQETMLISQDEETKAWRCARPTELYKAIACPEGHFKKAEEEVMNGCAESGLKCGEGFECLCNPCKKSFDVDVYPLGDPATGERPGLGCAKMSLCGDTQQRKPLAFRAIDNKKRERAFINVTVHDGGNTGVWLVPQEETANTYEFEISAQQVGILIIEISLDGEQIPESPLRVQISERDCDADYEFGVHRADAYGNCVCDDNTVSMGGSCVPLKIILPAILAPIAFLIAIVVYCYIKKKTREADSVWYVQPNELYFNEPPEVIGLGSFGLVLLGEYRGTKVAVKRGLAPRDRLASDFGSAAHLCRASAIFDKRLNSGNGSNSGVEQAKDEISKAIDVVKDADGENDEELGGVVKFASAGTSSGIYNPKKDYKETKSTKSSSASLFFFHGKNSFAQDKDNFIREMRLLSKLRHPCITTVMGAVVKKGEDPLLIMGKWLYLFP
jgi:guanylate cyclase